MEGLLKIKIISQTSLDRKSTNNVKSSIMSKPFICPHCRKTFQGKLERFYHIEENHPNEKRPWWWGLEEYPGFPLQIR